MKDWRSAIVERRSVPAAKTVRRLVWEPLAREMPPETTTVIIAPDGLMTAIPWAALPVNDRGAVLLDRYAVATVPYAPFGLELLSTSNRNEDGAGTLLGVGVGVVGEDPSRASPEIDMVIKLAGDRKVVRLVGAAATTASVRASCHWRDGPISIPTVSSPIRARIRCYFPIQTHSNNFVPRVRA